MKHKNIFLLGIFSLALIFTACEKFHCKDKDEKSEDFGDETAMLILDAGYSSEVTRTLQTSADFDYITDGEIEYSVNGEVVAKLDFGNGEKDVWADKDQNSTIEKCDLSGKKKKSNFIKVITSPLIKLTNCDYIVAGKVDYYKGKTLVATVDFGDGTCDEFATKYWPAGSDGNKTWPAGSKTFNLKYFK